ncbi:MAG: hypothetical protein D6694_06810 [Gammaproteobacteria bacterium]|nr:MAG: hypothetical protein D6694_06810 [Gammaproteobacteria bacterium]
MLAIEVAVPEGHRHLRARLTLADGRVLVLQEATLAALARAWVDIKADPLRRSCRLVGRHLAEGEGKPGYARWQLREEE